MSDSPGRLNLADLKREYEDVKKKEADKDRLIQKLFVENEKRNSHILKLESKLVNDDDLAGVYRVQKIALEGEVRDLKLQMTRSAFAIALIDGDSMLFEDKLVSQGRDGGLEVARSLKLRIQEHLKDEDISGNVTIVIRVFANLQGLGRIYQSSNIVSATSIHEEFIRGFNMGDPMCNYVDAGNGIACTDTKLNESFKLYIDNVQCRRIFFGGSTDSSYARLLSSYNHNGEIAKKIVLLEGAPWAREMNFIKDKFRTCSFKNVFRQTKILEPTYKRRAVSPATAILNRLKHEADDERCARQATEQRTTSPETPPNARGLNADEASPSISRTKMIEYSKRRPSPEASSTKRVKTEDDGERSAKDMQEHQITRPAANILERVKDMRLCAKFYLLDQCTHKNCRYEHSTKLSNAELRALRYWTKQRPCQFGRECYTRECIYSHD